MRGRQEQIIVTRPVRTRQSHHMESSTSNSGSTIPTQGEHLYIGEWKVEWVEGCQSGGRWKGVSHSVRKSNGHCPSLGQTETLRPNALGFILRNLGIHWIGAHLCVLKHIRR